MSEQRFDGTEILGAVSGLGKVEVKKIWEQVKANLKRLDECVGPHDFQRLALETKLMFRFRCTKCGGEIEGDNRSWYERGLKHGRQER